MIMSLERKDSQSNGEQPPINTPDIKVVMTREQLVERWKHEPAIILPYKAGLALDKDVKPYRYKSGKRLIIDGDQVMDECERPWCRATVKEVFNNLRPKRHNKVFSRGAGLFVMEEETILYWWNKIHKFDNKSTLSIDSAELNVDTAKFAKDKAKELMDQYPNLTITIHEGDAYEITRGFVDEGRRFDAYFPDTFPLDDSEKGLNDFLDTDNAKRLIPHGVGTGCLHYPGSSGGIMKAQRDLLWENYNHYSVISGPLLCPPPDYTFLQAKDESGKIYPVRNMPILVYSNPKFNDHH